MITLNVSTGSGSYPINIDADLLDRVHESVPDDASALVLISNNTVWHLYGEQVLESLQRTGKPVHHFSMPDGESHKNLDTLRSVYDFMLSHHFDRRAVLVALGGGVVGDLAGFASASYMRGIRFIQVPTTLLSQVDSSVGGKTGVNHPLGKNMIGAFHQPISVVIDTTVLETLPKREISAGLAEVIKYGLIMDAPFFEWCEQHAEELLDLEPEAMRYAISQSCQFKAKVVNADEKEAGVRALLNFGHTFAHAIEAGLGYGKWLHGEAVGCGMIQAAVLSTRTHGLPETEVERVRSLVEQIGCPTKAPDLGFDRWVDIMKHDKKAVDNEIKFVLLDRIGHALVSPAPIEDLKATVDETIE